MSDIIKLSQGDDGTIRIARVGIPGHGRNEKDDAPVVMVELTRDGDATVLVYADILSTEPTHEIPLGGAKLSVKEKAKEKADA